MAEIPALDDSVALWSAAPAERAGRPLLILLHGYGADEHDLFALTPHLPPQFVVAAVRAPLGLPFPSPGYSWYPIDGRDAHDPTRVTDAASLVADWIDAIAPETPVGLLGFSQGGAVALQAMRLRPERFAFAVNLSGYATPGPLPGDAALAERRPPVFWGRGSADQVIPEFLITHTVTWLPEHVELSGRVYPGLAHSVAEDELGDVRVFLDKRLEELDAQPQG